MKITLDSLLIEETYAGIYAGHITPGQCEARAVSLLRKLFGDERKWVCVLPTNDPGARLPRYVHIAWLVNFDINSRLPGDPDGQHLFVIRYFDEPTCDIATLLEGVDFVQQAADYYI